MPFEQLTFPEETQGGLKAIINFAKGGEKALGPLSPSGLTLYHVIVDWN